MQHRSVLRREYLGAHPGKLNVEDFFYGIKTANFIIFLLLLNRVYAKLSGSSINTRGKNSGTMHNSVIVVGETYSVLWNGFHITVTSFSNCCTCHW